MMEKYTPQQGDLILVKGQGLLGKGIEDFTKSAYCHVAGVVKINELVEANGFRKTGYQGLDFYLGNADVYICPSLTEQQRKIITEYVLKEVGSRYDYLLFAWEAMRYLLKKTFPYKETKSRICSTLWADAYLEAGIDLCPGIKYPSPADISRSKRLIKISSL